MYLCIFHMKSEKQSFSTTRLGSLAIGGVPVYFPGRDFPTQSPAGDYKEVPCHMYGFIRMLAKAAVWVALVRLFNWLMDEFLS